MPGFGGAELQADDRKKQRVYGRDLGGVYRIETDAKRRFLGLLRKRFSSGVHYNGRKMKWETVIELKAAELGRHLLGESMVLDFSEPTSTLTMLDGKELRALILSLNQSEARRRGIGKSTLHYLRKNVNAGRPFRLHRSTRDRLETIL